MKLDIAAIKARADKATAGPWDWNSRHGLGAPNRLVMWPSHEYGCDLDIEGEEADLDFIAHARTDIPDLIAALEASETARVKAEQERDAETAEFKNFHRMLCERFDCHVHDEIDWKRDQVSLMEAIAKRITDLEQGRDALRNFVADFADTNIAMLPMPHIKHPADEPDKAVSAAEVWEWQNDARRALETKP